MHAVIIMCLSSLNDLRKGRFTYDNGGTYMSERYQIVMNNIIIKSSNCNAKIIELSWHIQLKIGIATKSQVHTVHIVL